MTDRIGLADRLPVTVPSDPLIRSQPSSLSAKEVVAKAKSDGIKLSLAQVYTARSTAKKRGSTSKPAAA